jgi:hypothetical protein
MEKFVISVRKEDVQHTIYLPPKIVHDTSFIELYGKFKLFEFPLSVWYTDFANAEPEEDDDEAECEDDTDGTKKTILQRITILRQITSHPALLKVCLSIW